MKKIFNFNLFKESFKQCRVIGIICTVILSLIGILIPIGGYLNYKSGIENGIEKSYEIIFSSSESTLFLYLAFTIITPIIALQAFNFLTKRNSSDFYHSIPHTRTSTYFSILLSVILWAAISIFVPTILMSTFFFIFKAHLVINFAEIFIVAINIFICSLFVIASILIACSLTGTLLNNIVVSGIIIFLPRIIMIVICGIIESTNPFIFSFDAIPLFKPETNIVIAALIPNFSYDTNFTLIKFSGNGLYTLIISLIYLTIAGLLFKKRKSETAGNSSASKLVQAFARFSIGFVISLPIIEVLYGAIIESDNFQSSGVTFFIIIDAIIVVITMFIYELLSTRKINKALRALATSPLILVLDGIFVAILVGLFNVSLNYIPDVDDVKYIQLATYDEYDYISNKLASIEIDNEELTTLLVDQLEKNIKDFKDNRKASFHYSNSVQILFKDGYSTKSRYIFLDSKSLDKYKELIANCDEINEVYTSYPEIDSNKVTVSCDYLNTAKAKKIYSSLLEEIKANPEPIIKYYKNNDSYSINIFFTTYINGKECQGQLPILPEYSKSLELFKKYVNESSNTKLTEIQQVLNNLTEQVYLYDEVQVYITLYNFKDNTEDTCYFDYSNDIKTITKARKNNLTG